MKKYFIAASTFALMATTGAQAADAVRPVVEPVHHTVAPVRYNWEGFYAGGAVGGSWGRVKDSTSVGTSKTFDTVLWEKNGGGNKISRPDGWLGGLYAGYNFLAGDILVVGVDTDLNWSNAHAEYNNPATVPGHTTTIKLKQKWVGATRARIGLASDRFMPYFAAGIAYGQLDVTHKNSHTSTENNQERNFHLNSKGWTAGVGLDYAMTDNLLLRAEYRYTDLGKNTFEVAKPVPATHSVRYVTNEVRLGVAYKF